MTTVVRWRSNSRTTSRTTAWFALVGALWCAPSWAESPAAGDGEEATDDVDKGRGVNPWVDGPDAAEDDPNSLLRVAAPPRRPGATREVPVSPPTVPDEVLPVIASTSPVPPPIRAVTDLDREAIHRYGALNLEQALTQVMGLELVRRAPQTVNLASRGLGPSGVDVRIDGVPALTPSIFPERSALSDVALLDVARVRIHHGPAVQLGVTHGLGAVVDLDTFDAPRELGQSLPLHGEMIGGLGGPEILKTVQLRAEGGLGRARLTLSGSVVDTDDVYLGRGRGTLDASSSQGGTLGARADVTLARGSRVFATWQSARQTRIPVPEACVLDANRTTTDCTRLFDLGRDALVAGGSSAVTWAGVEVAVQGRAHLQRLLYERDRFGAGLPRVERRRDEALRAGGIGNIRVAAPGLKPFTLGAIPSLEIGGEVRRDRVQSLAYIRSTRGADADIDDSLGIETPAERSLVDGSRHGVDAALATARLDWPTVAVSAKVRVARDTIEVPRTVDVRVAMPLDLDAFSVSAELASRVQLYSTLAMFAAVHTVTSSPSVAALTLGPPLEEGPPLAPATGATATQLAGGELGATGHFDWLTLDVVSYFFQASGALKPIVEPSGLALRPGAPRFGAGLEVRAQWRTAIDGFTAEGTLAAPMLDEGMLTQGGDLVLPFVSMTPADNVTGPFGHLALRYAPSTNWFSGFVRSRFVAPHVRLGATERFEPRLCSADEIPLGGSVVPCVGAPGHVGLDVGGRFAPTGAFAIDAVAENLLDLPFSPRGNPLPWGGLGVRLKLTVNL